MNKMSYFFLSFLVAIMAVEYSIVQSFQNNPKTAKNTTAEVEHYDDSENLAEAKMKNSSSTIIINGKQYTGGSVVITGSGNIVINGKTVNTVVGDIVMTINGDVDVIETTAGNVKAKNVGSIKSTSGDINCENITGDVKTVSGNVRADSISGGVSTISGAIGYR